MAFLSAQDLEDEGEGEEVPEAIVAAEEEGAHRQRLSRAQATWCLSWRRPITVPPYAQMAPSLASSRARQSTREGSR